MYVIVGLSASGIAIEQERQLLSSHLNVKFVYKLLSLNKHIGDVCVIVKFIHWSQETCLQNNESDMDCFYIPMYIVGIDQKAWTK